MPSYSHHTASAFPGATVRRSDIYFIPDFSRLKLLTGTNTKNCSPKLAMFLKLYNMSMRISDIHETLNHRCRENGSGQADGSRHFEELAPFYFTFFQRCVFSYRRKC